MKEKYDNLTPEQKAEFDKEIHELEGPLLLLAGPGTGKTYRLALRVKYLIEEEKVDPKQITVITFTGAAARNMHDRISDPNKKDLYIPPSIQPGLICTMHSLGFRIINENASDIGYSNNIQVITSDVVRNTLIEDAAQIAGFNRSDSKQTIQCRQYGNCKPTEEIKCKICKQYRSILQICSAIDYDDQILLTNNILLNNKNALEKYQEKCKYLLIDEYQDINAGQYELIKLLTKDQAKGLFAVGDDDQSIYSWRGGSPQFIRNFKTDFGEKAKIIPLLKSYRCSKHILEGAMSIIKKYDNYRLEKGDLEYIKQNEKVITIHNVPSDQKEARIVKSIIEKSLPSRSVLVLIPHRGFAGNLINEFKNSKINYLAPLNIPGNGLPFIAILTKWLNNQNDNISFRQLLTALIDNPDFGIPSKRSRKEDKKKEREEILRMFCELWSPLLNKKVPSLWHSLILEKEKNKHYTEFHSALEKIINLFNIQDKTSDFISYLVDIMKVWKKNEDFLTEVDSWVEMTNFFISQNIDVGIKIMTLQGAKGLEADIVCIIGLENGILPKEGISEKEFAEQSRLMLVSMTRAKEELHLFHARKRLGSIMFKSMYQNGKPKISRSTYIDDIPKEHIEEIYHK